MTPIEEIKERLDVVDLISETVTLRKSGKNYTGFCPFHDNKRTPSFAVFPESGTWRCFGQCSEGGDVFKFVMKKEGWDFPETLKYLADKAGVRLTTPTPHQQEKTEKNDQLRELLEDAVTFFRHQLTSTPAGKSTLDYIHNRELTDTTIETWGLGYAPNSWDMAMSHFLSRGYSREDLIGAGMVSQRDDGRIYDRFRHRLMFPIRDERGGMAGFGARALEKDATPKYLNTAQTDLFDKGHLLYGLDLARREIRSRDQVVIVEGYMDVIALHQHGYNNAVSPMGTALTEHQLRLLKRRTRKIVLALDADAAGNRATLRGLQVARETMDRETELSFDARGLLRKEARLQADIRVTTLPEGKDPDEVVNADPTAWAAIIEAAKPVVIHVMDTLAAERDIDDPKVKSDIAEQVLPLIDDVPNAIERDTYRQRLARLLKVDERVLVGTKAPAKTTRRTKRTPRPQQGQGHVERRAVFSRSGSDVLEGYCLGVLLRHPDLIFLADRALQKNGLARLSPTDFQSTDHQMMLQLIQKSVEQDYSEPVHAFIGSLPESLMDAADQLLAKTKEMDPNEDRVLEDLLRTVLKLRKQNIKQNIEQIQFLMQDSEGQPEELLQQYKKTMVEHAILRQRIDRALGQRYTRAILTG